MEGERGADRVVQADMRADGVPVPGVDAGEFLAGAGGQFRGRAEGPA